MGSGFNAEGMIVHHIFRLLVESNSTNPPSFQSNSISKFNPSMAIIIIVLISAFLFMGFFSIYVRRCTHPSPDADNHNAANQARTSSAGSRSSQGLDKAVIESLPLVGYNLVKGHKGGKDLIECAVCLSDFEDEDQLRLLPKCGHVFHPDCIDMWFHSHSTCPLCRASLVPAEGKDVDGEGAGENQFSEEFQNWVSSRGIGPHGETFTIHDGPPVPPNGSILELLSQDGADRILAESLRRTESVDAGLSRLEGEDENTERVPGIRALNRALSKNSTSFRKASRGIEAGTGSARFNSSSVAINIDALDAAVSAAGGSGHHSQSFNLRRSSSVGSSGRYIRNLLGLNYETFSPGSGHQDGTRLLSSQQSLPSPIRRERSGNQLNIEIPTWDDIDLNAEHGSSGPYTLSSNPPGVLPLERWASRRRREPIQELAKRGPNGDPRKDQGKEKEVTPAPAAGNRSDRWSFGQSFRRTFSFRRTSSNASDVESSSQQGNTLPGPSSSRPRRWSGAMNFRRTGSSGADSVPSPRSPSSMPYPESLPLESIPQSRPALVDGQHQQESQQQHQHQRHPSGEDLV